MKKAKTAWNYAISFYSQEGSKPEFYQAKIDASYQKVNNELNQNSRIEHSLSEIRCKVYSDSMTDACLYLSKWQRRIYVLI